VTQAKIVHTAFGDAGEGFATEDADLPCMTRLIKFWTASIHEQARKELTGKVRKLPSIPNRLS